MANYALLTVWRIDAPLEQVYATIHDAPRWPQWWPGLRSVTPVSAGDANGINSRWRFCWKGKLPYQLTFGACVTRVEKLALIEGTARGDLDGSGRWLFSRDGDTSVVHCEWRVRSTVWWMNLLAPLIRAVFVRNHARLMAQGAAGLARRLNCGAISQTNIDLMAAADAAPGARAPHSLAALLFAGLFAGSVATLAQLALWLATGVPLLTLLRDARLTAALVLGGASLDAPPALWPVVALATVIHFGLSSVYAIGAGALVHRLARSRALLAGALYGLAIYVINLYGLTALFPWFAVSRGAVTLIAHLVFGVSLVAAFGLFERIIATLPGRTLQGRSVARILRGLSN